MNLISNRNNAYDYHYIMITVNLMIEKVIGIHSSGGLYTTNPRNYGNFIGLIYRYFNPSNKVDEFGNNDDYLRTIYENSNAVYRRRNINIYNYIEPLDEPIDYDQKIIEILKKAYK